MTVPLRGVETGPSNETYGPRSRVAILFLTVLSAITTFSNRHEYILHSQKDVYTELLWKSWKFLDSLNPISTKEFSSSSKNDLDIEKFGDCEQEESREHLEKVHFSEVFKSKFIHRNEWGAIEPRGKVNDLQKLPKYVIIIHSASTERALTENQCAAEVRSYQIYHMYNKGWSDIAYNFLIGEDGNVYEGRGWGKEGAHTLGHNKESIGICFIGNFEKRLPNQRALKAAKDLIRRGVEEGKIPTDFILKGHRDLRPNFLSPGECLYQGLQKWTFNHGK
ncbi:peptidoglycan recognition protein 1-like [Saccostrea cucullata]|uniref:peptidoglycan recognition protein 1-like n=1 Tax=Saccostrea cuccullata TaxID=36930 RepID=UPI002ED6232E